MKNTIKYFLQTILGFSRYLYVFSKFKIATLHWDKKEGDFFLFLSLLKKQNGAILDVGANIGIMTAHLSKNFPSDSVFAIEPMPDNLDVLKRIVKNKNLTNVQIIPFAVGSQAGTLQMILPQNGKTKMQGLSHVKCDEITDWNEGQEFEVEVKTLDELFGHEKIQGIKMDVENYEFHALTGAAKILHDQRPIVYTELWDNENRQKCLDWMNQLNYQTWVVVDKKLVEFDSNKHPNQNFIFLPN